MNASPRAKGRIGDAAALGAVLLVAALVLGLRFDRDWIPHDEGTMAQSAERILRGEWPWRDVEGPYTGGLSALHAAVFRLLGTRLLSLRWLLLALTFAFLPAVYRIARRFAAPATSALVTLAALAWSVPNYFASLPSWYNLFLATFGLLALLRHAEGRAGSGALLVAGLCGGASILCKSAGLFSVAAALLYLVYRDQSLCAARRTPGPSRGYGLFTALGLLAFLAVLLRLGAQRPTFMGMLHFVLPGAALVGLLLARELGLRGCDGGERWRRFLTGHVAFGLGLALPLLAFALPYLLTSGLDRLVRGVLEVPAYDSASVDLPRPTSLVLALPFGLVLAAGFFRRGAWLDRVGVLGAAALGLAFVLSRGGSPPVYAGLWDSVRPTVPLAVACGVFVLARGRGAAREPVTDQRLFLLLAAAWLASLIQLPFPAGIYFCYAAPLIALAILAVSASQPFAPRRMWALVALFYAVYAGLWMHRGRTYDLGFAYTPVPMDTRLDVPRGGLRIPAEEAEAYRELVSEIQKHSATGSAILALPDSPEVYFLAERVNPTPYFFEAMYSEFRADQNACEAWILERIREREVDVVVLRHYTEFTQSLGGPFVTELQRRYLRERVLPGFTVRWRERSTR